MRRKVMDNVLAFASLLLLLALHVFVGACAVFLYGDK